MSPLDHFTTALHGRRSTGPTQCSDWTVHDLLAHVTAGSAEIADLAELALAGGPVRPTRGFEERERPFRAMRPGELRQRFDTEVGRAGTAIVDLLAAEADLPFTGTSLSPTSVLRHAETELVLHRWDLTGGDAIDARSLEDPELLRHTVEVVAAMRPRVIPFQYAGGPSAPLVVLRSEDQTDVVLDGATVTLDPTPPDAPVIELHPAARVLLLWGRTPGDLPAPSGDPSVVAAVHRALAPSTDQPSSWPRSSPC